jgi:hypothetical protein
MRAPRAANWRPRRRKRRRQQVAGGTPPLVLDSDTVKIVADLTAKAYADERDRFKAVDTRIGLLLSATSAVTALVVTILIKPPDVIVHVPASARATTGVVAWLYIHADAVYYCSIAFALVYFVRAEWVDEFPRLRLSYWVDKATLARSSPAVQAELASAYRAAVEGYTEVTGRKLQLLRRGAVGLLIGIAVLVLVPVSVVILISVVQ